MILGAACLLLFGGAPSAQQADAVKAAATALGVANIKTLGFAATGTAYSIGQNFTASDPWPPVPVATYTAVINYDTGSMRQELLREMGTTMPRGGGAPFTGQQRQNQVVSGNFAWNVPVVAAAPAPAPGGAPQAAPAGPPPAPAPGNQVERMLMVWATPQGFIKAATANNATQKTVAGGTEVSFTVGGKYKMTGLINSSNQVEKVQTWIDQPIVGDMLVETVYSGYKTFGGVMFPSKMVQSQDGYPVLDLNILDVTANIPVEITVPDPVRNAPPPPPVVVTSTKLAEGVFYLTGGTHHSLAVEENGYIILVDTPLNEARAAAVIAKAKEVIPKKPIRFIVTSHHHWDHLGGIRTAMAEGATIVTHTSNKAFLERVAKTPHTLNPDKMAMSPKPLKLQLVGAMAKLGDKNPVELHLLTGYEHTGDMLVTYLPKDGILAEPDAFTPPAMAGTPLIAPAVPYAAALYDNIQRLKLNVKTIAPFHGGRQTDVAEVGKAAGKSAASN
jgi:glyoxylase-like metal-dependent hydrolase (beta-lactamase superfamily II)